MAYHFSKQLFFSNNCTACQRKSTDTHIELAIYCINTLAAGLNQAVRKKQLIGTWLCG